MSDDLVKRLRSSRAVWENSRSRPTDDESAAADRIEQLERELSISRMAQVVMDNTVESLTAERDAARIALKETCHD